MLLFSGEYYYFYFFMNICAYVYVCVSVCAQLSLPNKYKNLNIRSGQEMRLSSSDAFLPSASRRRRAQHSSVAHIDPLMHLTDRQRTAEVKPSLPLQLCLSCR